MAISSAFECTLIYRIVSYRIAVSSDVRYKPGTVRTADDR